MANVQKQFEKFHGAIRTDYELNAELAEKRDIVLELVRNYVRKRDLPGFERILQGSYKMKTGVKPLGDREYDIDVGLLFDTDESQHLAKEVRSWVFDAVEGHTRSVVSMPHCIRVEYERGYHVDLVSYAKSTAAFSRHELRLAHDKRGWLASDPNGLYDQLSARWQTFDGTEDATDIDQMRRTIRYLKRWDDEAMLDDDPNKPSGLAFTLLVRDHLPVRIVTFDNDPDDLSALRQVARATATAMPRIRSTKPTPEYEDLFERITESGMTALKQRFQELADALDDAERDVDPVVACERLQKVLGDDFPVPDRSSTGVSTQGPAIISSSSSA